MRMRPFQICGLSPSPLRTKRRIRSSIEGEDVGTLLPAVTLEITSNFVMQDTEMTYDVCSSSQPFFSK
jgi:hypothetical protein